RRHVDVLGDHIQRYSKPRSYAQEIEKLRIQETQICADLEEEERARAKKESDAASYREFRAEQDERQRRGGAQFNANERAAIEAEPRRREQLAADYKARQASGAR